MQTPGVQPARLQLNVLYWLAVLLLDAGSLLLESLIFADPWPQQQLQVAVGLALAQCGLTSGWLWLAGPRYYQPWRFMLGSLLAGLLFVLGSNALLLWQQPTPFVLTALLSQLDTQLLAFFVWASLCLLSQSLARQQHQHAQAAAMQAELHQLELHALQQQLNPHFTFNTLNSLVGLLETDRFDDAEQMTAQLAGFLRYSLQQPADQLVPLRSELAALQRYLTLQQIRFGGRLRLHWQLADHIDHLLIPPLLLQPLLENAVKYAVAPSKTGADIQLAAHCDQQYLSITVTDNGSASCANSSPDSAGQANQPGVGLANVSARLQAFFGPAARLETSQTSTGFQACIRIRLTQCQPHCQQIKEPVHAG